MRLYSCDEKTILRFHNQGVKFIKDYTSNITRAPRNAFIDAKGRIMGFFDQVRVNDDEIWAVLEKKSVGGLLEHLYKFLYITDTKADPIPSWNIYWDLEGDVEPAEEDVVIPQKAGIMILTKRKLKCEVTKADMTLFRVLNNIPLHGTDFHDEMILCVADEERVSYLKGCYLGQEIVARVHYKGAPPKKLVAKLLRDCSPDQQKQMTSRVTDPRSGDFIGFVFDKT